MRNIFIPTLINKTSHTVYVYTDMRLDWLIISEKLKNRSLCRLLWIVKTIVKTIKTVIMQSIVKIAIMDTDLEIDFLNADIFFKSVFITPALKFWHR